jgi:hypothetical protein
MHNDYTFAQFSKPLTGTAVPYTEHDNFTDVLAVPGDLNTAITTRTYENIFKPAQGAPVLFNAGRTIFTPFTVEFEAGSV